AEQNEWEWNMRRRKKKGDKVTRRREQVNITQGTRRT
ncbi:Ras-related protein Rab-26, partial [Nibea albiflora]